MISKIPERAKSQAEQMAEIAAGYLGVEFPVVDRVHKKLMSKLAVNQFISTPCLILILAITFMETVRITLPLSAQPQVISRSISLSPAPTSASRNYLLEKKKFKSVSYRLIPLLLSEKVNLTSQSIPKI